MFREGPQPGVLARLQRLPAYRRVMIFSMSAFE